MISIIKTDTILINIRKLIIGFYILSAKSTPALPFITIKFSIIYPEKRILVRVFNYI